MRKWIVALLLLCAPAVAQQRPPGKAAPPKDERLWDYRATGLTLPDHIKGGFRLVNAFETYDSRGARAMVYVLVKEATLVECSRTFLSTTKTIDTCAEVINR